MDEWWEERRWLRRHATAAPFGIFATTLLIAYWLEQWQWHGRDTWSLVSEQVDLGTVVYAMAAVLFERGVKLMFWAWDERKKWRAKAREEGRAEEAQRYDAWLAKVAAEKDIPLAELMPPPREDAR